MPNIQAALGILMLRNGENKVLLIREKGDREWKFPGGKIKPGEKSGKGALRELLEELGEQLKLKLGVFHPFMEFSCPTKHHKKIDFKVYMVELINDSAGPVDPHKIIAQVSFFSLRNRLPLTPAAKKILKKLRQDIETPVYQ